MWKQSLDAAGIREPQLRRDYTAQRRLVARARRSSYLAARLLLPRPVLPHVVAATAVMHHSDNLLDTGPKPQRIAAWASWEQQLRKALETGEADVPLIRALLNTITDNPRLRPALEEYLSTADTDLDFHGFTTESDYQAYVDAYSLPAFWLVAVLLEPETDAGRYRALCRTFIDGSQRLDFVNDLAEDLREGHLGIPTQTLERFSVSMEDLTAGVQSPALDELVTHEVETAREALHTARELPTLVATPHQALLAAVIDIELLTADAALARGAALLQGSANPPLPGTLRALRDARRRARGQH